MTDESQWPICSRKFRLSAFIGPKGYIVTGTKMCVRACDVGILRFFRMISLLRKPNLYVKMLMRDRMLRECPPPWFPTYDTSVLPGNEDMAIGAFPVVSKQPSWFVCGRNIIDHSSGDGETIFQCSSCRVCVCAALCCATRINVRFIQVKSKTLPDCDTNGLVAHMNAA